MRIALKEIARRSIRDPLVVGSALGVLGVFMWLRIPSLVLLFTVPISLSLFRAVLPYLKEQGFVEAVDLDLLFLSAHMWAVSTGKPPRRRLFELGVIVKGYGYYQHVLRRIAVLASEWAYGFARATRIVASEVRNKYLRDFLYRLSEVFRTGEDVSRFLRVEFSTLINQFVASYNRAIDLMRVYLGLYTALISSLAFVVIVLMLLALFLGGGTSIVITSIIAIVALVSFLAPLAKVLSPEDPLVYTSETLNPRLRRLSRVVYIGVALAAVSCLAVLLFTHDPLLALAGLALPLIYPGVSARRFQNYMRRLASFYQVFLRSFGLTFSLMPNYAKALESILRAEYDVLTSYIRRLHARISNGIDPHVALRNFALETSSMDIVRTVNIVSDTIDAGGDIAEVGLALSDLLIKFGDLRVYRNRVARTFEAVVYMMQGLLSAIVASIVEILVMFAEYYRRLSAITLPGGISASLVIPITIPNLDVISVSMAFFLSFMMLINSLTITFASGDIIETSLFHVSMLSLVTVVGAKSMSYLAHALVLPLLIPSG